MGNYFPWFEFGHYLYQAFVYCKYGGDNFPISFVFCFCYSLTKFRTRCVMINTYILLFANIFVVIVVSIVYIKRLFTCKSADCLAMKFEHNLITLILNKGGFEFTKAFSIYLLQLCQKRYDMNKCLTYYFLAFWVTWREMNIYVTSCKSKWSVLACIMTRFQHAIFYQYTCTI